MLNFGSNVEVSVARFGAVSTYSNIECQIRRNGRIQLNSENKRCAVKCFIILKHSGADKIKISEETTETEFAMENNNPINLPNLSDENFQALFDGFDFLDKIHAYKDIAQLRSFIKENQPSVINYIFDSPLNVFENRLSESEYSQMIFEYGLTLRKQIYNLLVNFSAKTFCSLNKNINTSWNFRDYELMPQRTQPIPLQRQTNMFDLSDRFCSVGTPMVPAVSCQDQCNTLRDYEEY
jgi:hypothetical protein